VFKLSFRFNEQSHFFAGHYKVQLFDPRTNGFAPSSPGIGMHVEIRDPDDKIILSKVYSTEGKWTFTSSAPGTNSNLLGPSPIGLVLNKS
jgi:hypothetical protein